VASNDNAARTNCEHASICVYIGAPEQQAIYVSIWSKAVETQMHFNEMSVKSRQFGLALLLPLSAWG
jgi:hypothetical protein